MKGIQWHARSQDDEVQVTAKSAADAWRQAKQVLMSKVLTVTPVRHPREVLPGWALIEGCDKPRRTR
jgi:hypothetical protein